ncbi:uncharacterized protein LOC113324707 [Papaver somniferum]|uniref:uncharacterized protein LOC113324707 n=1 Tax=Papaver somniferum TaxID=3469 RepID=UPI000E6FF1B3|nr:uncharacterized protein LOC113324707 [Papaver somniferum]
MCLANSVPSNIQKEEAGEVVENELPGDNKQLHKEDEDQVGEEAPVADGRVTHEINEEDDDQVNEEALLEDAQVTQDLNEEDDQVNEEALLEDVQVTQELNEEDDQVNGEAPVEHGQVTQGLTEEDFLLLFARLLTEGQVTHEINEENDDQVNEDGQVTHEINEEDGDQVNEEAPVTVEIHEEGAHRESVCDFSGLEPLCEAVDQKDWKTAIKYVMSNQTTIEEIFRVRDLGKEIEVIFGKAVFASQWNLVEEIAKLAPPKALERLNALNGFTILHMAAAYGNIKIVQALVNKNPYLTQIRCSRGTGGLVPLTLASMSASDDQKEILEYLYPVTRDYVSQVTGDAGPSPFANSMGACLVIALIEADSYGTALSICRQFPYLVKQMVAVAEGEYSLLQKIVERPFSFLSGANLTWWERSIYSLIEVNMDRPMDYDITIDKDKLSPGSSKGTKKDEENPPETSKGSATSEGISTDYKGNITGYISVYLRRYLMLVPHVKQLYNKKLMHQQAVALVKNGLTSLYESKTNLQLENYFSNSSIMSTAIKYGSTEFVLECLGTFRFLIYHPDLSLKISKMVIEERNVKMFNYICEENEKLKRDRLSFLDENKNTILHYAATLASTRQLNSIPGAAFQVQKQMQWFKGVESIVLRKDRFVRNGDGHTARFLFTENHKELMGKGETWMKDTSGSCMLVGALIATVAFAAALTVPGGNVSDNSSNTGIPVFLQKKSFMVFAIADALALFSSITSVMMFLTVYTSRYSEEDFLKSLPQKMIIGLATLFLSMATILVSFGAAFTIVLGKRFSWAPIAMALFGCVPVFLFGFLQFPFFVGMVRSTFWPIIFWKRKLRI